MYEMTRKEQELRDEAYGRLRIWRDGCREIHDRAKEARKILLLQDPKQDKDAGRKTIQLQTLKSTFNNCVADQMDNMPEALMLPETAQLSELSEDMTDIVRFVMNRNNYESLHRKRVEDCFCTGTSITQIAWDPSMDDGKGNVAVVRWPVEAFLWDPAADDVQNARAVFKLSWHPMSWYKEHYPDRYEAMGTDEFVYDELAMPDAQKDNQVADEGRAMLFEYWYRKYDAKTMRYSINVAFLAGGIVLEQMENVYAHGMYPFVLDVYTPIEGLPVGDGLIQEMIPMMRYVNRYASYIDMNLRMASKGRLLIDRNAGIDKEALLNWENDVVEGDRIDPSALQWLQNQPFTSMVTQQMLQLQTDIKQDSGQNQFTRGETAGGVTAASAISALQEAGGKITRLRTNVFNQGFKAIVEQVLWLISQFYDKKRVLFVTGDKNGIATKREIQADPERLFGRKGSQHLPPPPYTVQIQVQRRNPLRQQAQNELIIQAYNMSAQSGQYFPLSTLFELLYVDGKDRIIPVLRQNEAYMQQMQQMQAQVEQQASQIQQMAQGMANLYEINEQLMSTQTKRGAGSMNPSEQASEGMLAAEGVGL